MNTSEEARLHALRELNLLDTAPSESFDRITRMAARLFGVPIAAVSLTDTDRQWFKSRVGVEHWQISRERAPCGEVAECRDVLVVPDLLEDTCYRHSLLAGSGVRFYAGAPLVTREGHGLGAMCVLGTEPRQVTEQEIAALQDLAAMVMAQIELQHAFGRVDPVSGLPNRHQFIEDVDDLARDHPGAQKFAVLIDLIDVAQHTAALRAIGPSFTDEIVEASIRQLRRMLGLEARIYQVGTTHVGYLLPEMNDAALVAATDPVRGQIASVTIRSAPVVVRPAVGVAPFRLGEMTPQDVLRTAHSAAQDAREAEANVRVYSKSLDEAHQRRFQLLADFPKALAANDQLSLAYQPRLDLRSGLCVGAEALLRWRHPTLGDVSPGEFIPLVEQTTLARDATEWVLRTALGQAATWRDSGTVLTISVNISASNLEEEDLPTRLVAMARRLVVPPEAIELELTESAVVRNGPGAIERMNAIRAAGFTFAIDDFGTGYSSLSYLESIPASVVKIDRSFMRGLSTDDRGGTLVSAMISLIHNLGYRVVAEGVETQAVFDTLAAMGCDEVQGYFVARPMPAVALEEWLLGPEGSRFEPEPVRLIA